LKYNLPVKCEFGARELADKILSDKKRMGENITFVLPNEIGDAYLREIPVCEAENFIAGGLERN